MAEANSRFHIKSGRDFEVKELFKKIAELAREFFSAQVGGVSILDVGCASGELPYFLQKELQNSGQVCGVDLDSALIKNAQERFGDSGIHFETGDAASFALGRKFDLITATSLLSYFEDPRDVMQNILNHLTEEGLLIVTGLFNDYDIEVRLRYKVKGQQEWNCGFNQFSLSGFSEMVHSLGFHVAVEEQVMPFDIPPGDNVLRSWSMMVNGKRYMTNGLQLLWNIKILRISRKAI